MKKEHAFQKKNGKFLAEAGNRRGEKLTIEYEAVDENVSLDIDFIISLYELVVMFHERI